jgi:hypothetical protein
MAQGQIGVHKAFEMSKALLVLTIAELVEDVQLPSKNLLGMT